VCRSSPPPAEGRHPLLAFSTGHIWSQCQPLTIEDAGEHILERRPSVRRQLVRPGKYHRACFRALFQPCASVDHSVVLLAGILKPAPVQVRMLTHGCSGTNPGLFTGSTHTPREVCVTGPSRALSSRGPYAAIYDVSCSDHSYGHSECFAIKADAIKKRRQGLEVLAACRGYEWSALSSVGQSYQQGNVKKRGFTPYPAWRRCVPPTEKGNLLARSAQA